jgi:hypothetical protein
MELPLRIKLLRNSGVLVALEDGARNAVVNLVYLYKDLDLVLVHALVRVSLHHVVQRVFNRATLGLFNVCNWNIVYGHLRLKA